MCLLLSLFAVPVATGQQADGPAFEAASVKPNRSGEARFTFTYQGNTFRATNATLRMLIRNAYQVQDSQIFGGPGWINDDRFDIVAKGMSVPLQPSQSRSARDPAGYSR